ncbi:MAG: GntR family transcriptional regulator [Capsulimonadaceae bacterium]|nr:GntR family transcriptional regulator [Capsulimonadaceae bacterium]
MAYARLASDLRTQIADGRLAPGCLIPSIRRLAEQNGVAIGTAQQAVKDLLTEGLLRSEDRRGLFVVDHATDGSHSTAISSPAPPARDLQGARIGIVIDHQVNFWDELVVHGMEPVLTQYGMVGVPSWRQGGCGVDLPLGVQAARLRAEGCAAVLILAVVVSQIDIDEVIRDAGGMDVPIVFATGFDVDRPLWFAHYGNRDAGFQAATHLLKTGWEKLIFTTNISVTWAIDRLRGAQMAVRAAVPPIAELAVLNLEKPMPVHSPSTRTFFQDCGVEAGHMLLARQGEFDGIVAVNDRMAIGIMDVMAAAGRVAGRDYGIVGFDNVDNAAIEYGLTSLRPPLVNLGEEVARLCVELLQGQSQCRSVRLQSHIIARASTQRIAPAMEV